MNKDAADTLAKIYRRLSGALNNSLLEMQPVCTAEEFRVQKQIIGRMMGIIHLDVLTPLFEEFPEIIPEDLRPPPKKP